MQLQESSSVESGVVARRQDARWGVGGGLSVAGLRACGLLLQPAGPPTTSGPTILSPFRLAGLPSILPVAMAASVAGMLRRGLLPQAGKERPRSSRHVTAGAL